MTTQTREERCKSCEIHKAIGNILRSISNTCECMRKEDAQGIVSCLPILFSTMTVFWNRVGVNILEAAWLKYPGVCPYCLREKICSCIVQELHYSRDKDALEALREDKENRPQSIAEWQTMLERIYGNVNKIKSTYAVWFHFIEEIGEVSSALENDDCDNLLEECADMFAWFLAFCTKLHVSADKIAEAHL